MTHLQRSSATLLLLIVVQHVTASPIFLDRAAYGRELTAESIYGQHALSAHEAYSGDLVNSGWWNYRPIEPLSCPTEGPLMDQHGTTDPLHQHYFSPNDRQEAALRLYETTVAQLGLGVTDTVVEIGSGLGAGACHLTVDRGMRPQHFVAIDASELQTQRAKERAQALSEPAGISLHEIQAKIARGEQLTDDELMTHMRNPPGPTGSAHRPPTVSSGPNIHFETADAANGDRLPFDDASVDKIFSVETVQHFGAEGIDNFLREASRILRPGQGKMVISTYFTRFDAYDSSAPSSPAQTQAQANEKALKELLPMVAAGIDKPVSIDAFKAALERANFVQVGVMPIGQFVWCAQHHYLRQRFGPSLYDGYLAAVKAGLIDYFMVSAQAGEHKLATENVIDVGGDAQSEKRRHDEL